MKCDIIIPIWNQLAFTKDCLEHIVKNTRYPYRLILVDNASDKDTREYLGKFASDNPDKATLIRNEHNAGYIKAINQGFKVSDASYVCMMNNDTLPAPGWLERMVEFAESHTDVGLINPQCGGHDGASVDPHAATLERYKGEYMEMNQCQGFCMLVKRELIDKIGVLDESYGVGGYDDTDYSIRAHKAGYRSVSIRDSYVYHRIHGSFDEAGNREEVVKRNRDIYYKKWGKHLRIGVLFSLDTLDALKIARLAEYIYGLAREWSWVHIWINSALGKDAIRSSIDDAVRAKNLAPHQNIRIDYFNLPRLLFDLTISGKLVERMRKRMRDKRFDAIVFFDGYAGHLTEMTTKLLKSCVMKIASPKAGSICKAPLKVPYDWFERGRIAAIGIKEARDGR
ncbi:MAG: glycosyltransferase family 2 protein [Candidatus Omnitrophica bacterium]|nr:glycosyltransferase family 2 protein [Candidatus Omnitrophota bacterium]MBU0895532.1 glycosyltransferase family 2 protein [Candidatus Omnitrophota bacterium]MBU1808051.1 glycosyltransferase family 2 protein [Candidatus Omnitrophota bacterium]